MPSRRERLDKLLKFVLEAHGGLNAWNKFQSLRANVSIGVRFGIQGFFVPFFKEFAKPERSFEMLRQDVEGDTTYIV
jgi:hypothetical protein